MSGEDKDRASEEKPKEGDKVERAPSRAPNPHQTTKQTLMLGNQTAEVRKALEEHGKKPDVAKPDAKPKEEAAKTDADAAKPPAGDPTPAKPHPLPTPLIPPPSTEPNESTGTIKVTYFGMTDVGLVREHNEDNFLVADLATRVRGIEGDKPRNASVTGLGTLLAVCDGMGGAAAGEVASKMAVDTIYDILTSWPATTDRDLFARRLVRAVEEAGHRIYNAAKMDRTRRGMGTTATVAGLMDKVLFIGQVGDSRAYLRRGDSVSLITKDQSLVNQLIEAGQLTEEEAEAFEHSNIILQALGTTDDVQVNLTFLELRKGDRLMLCSDGLSGLVHPDLISDVLRTTPNLVTTAQKLVSMANAGGGHDNITIIVAEFDGETLALPTDDVPALYQPYPLPPSDDDETIPPRAKARSSSPEVEVKPTPDSNLDTMPTNPSGHAAQAPRPRWRRPAIVVALACCIMAVGFLWAIAHLKKSELLVAPIRGLIELVSPKGNVDIIANVEGELFVDGHLRGRLDGEETLTLALPLGSHRFEARSGGMMVAGTTLAVTRNGPNRVELMLPVDHELIAIADGGAEAAPDAGKSTQVRPPVPPPKEEPVTTPAVAPQPAAPPPPTPPAATPPTNPVAPAPSGTTPGTATPPKPAVTPTPIPPAPKKPTATPVEPGTEVPPSSAGPAPER